ncbi:MAG: hypothetical protein ACOCRZ_02690 [Halothermotrichaceae bacterium]
MHDKAKFIFNETRRSVKQDYFNSLYYFINICISHFFIVGCFIFCLNTQYVKQKVCINILPEFIDSWYNSIGLDFDILKIAMVLSVLLFCIYSFHINKRYLEKFLKSYDDEKNLILKLGCDKEFIRKPVLYTGIFINTISVFFTYIIIKGLYYVFSSFIKDIGILLLDFYYFNLSLITFIVTIALFLVFITTYYLFWKYKI